MEFQAGLQEQAKDQSSPGRRKQGVIGSSNFPWMDLILRPDARLGKGIICGKRFRII
jgi:hypothetical protein